MATMRDDAAKGSAPSGHAVVHDQALPRAELTTGQLIDHLEWSYNEGLPFDADIVWELARRALAAESQLSSRVLPSSNP